jgi:type II secretory ATPase GspE/PulE/Tfp pilus assembly ATPase PilB-like protein
MMEEDKKQIEKQKDTEAIVRGVLQSAASLPKALKSENAENSSEDMNTAANSTTKTATDEPQAVSTPAGSTPEKAEKSDIVDDNPEAGSVNILKTLFANDNKLLTSVDGELNVDDDTRRMLALFSDGSYIIDESHRFDGKVLNFTTNMRRRKVQMNAPKYVSASVITAIYAYADRGTGKINVSAEEAADYQMQIDFLRVINRAAAKKVSDVHVVVADSTLVLFRISGMMERELEYPKEWGESFVRAAFASADISDANYAQNEFQGAQKLGSTPLRGTNGKLKLPHNVLAIRLQFNPVAFGSQYLVMRLLYADDNPNGNGDLRSLGLGERELDLFYRLRATAVGLNIIAGPTGSGKSTTLQRNLIRLIQERKGEINVITVEDPPEYPIPGARQMPVTNANSEEEKDEEFTKALSAALRSDPDVMMVGEIRSLSAASLVFKGALSGHSVWSTLHANSAPAIVTRLRDMGVQPYMLSDPEIMKGLISQRLFRKICPYCRVSVKERMSDPSFARLKTALGDYGVENTYLRGPGCKFCNHKGVIGRMSVPEIIIPDAHFLQLIVSGDTKNAIDYWVSDLDGRPLREAAIERMLKGYIDLDEVERWCGLLDQRPIY